MSDEPILLFLHGIGTGDPEDVWRASLVGALEELGYPGLAGVTVVAPKYAHALKGWDEKEPLPEITIKPLSREAARQNRRGFERRMGGIEFRLGRHDRGQGWLGGAPVVSTTVALGALPNSPVAQAHNYLHNGQIRAQVLRRILAPLPESGRLVIVGHSLGSVIAADLVRRLPVGLEVVGMVTAGSPLANGGFDVDKLRESLTEPPTNVGWWVNFWNVGDAVAAHRGVSSVFPWMLDLRLSTGEAFPASHSARSYLGNAAVATAIGFALHGSLSKEVAEVEKGVDVALDAEERLTLTALRYAHLIRQAVGGELLERYSGALRQVQGEIVDDLMRRRQSRSEPIPSAVAHLAVDLSDSEAQAPTPPPSASISKDEAVTLMLTLTSVNLIRPFEIAIAKDKQQTALKDLTAEMGLGSQFGSDVFSAIKRAQHVIGGSSSAGRIIKWSAVGVGAAAIVVATGGLALAAAPGVAGAAVITTALASFGPGGMIGGLLTAGTLVTAGGGGIAFGLASPGTSAEALEAVVERQLAAAILRQLQGLERDPAIWRILMETEIAVRREYERLDEFSDESAPTLTELRRKIEAVERALMYLRANGLEPDVGIV